VLPLGVAVLADTACRLLKEKAIMGEAADLD
jgi:hypothetical protein